MASSTRYDIVIDQGSAFSLSVDLLDDNDDLANTSTWTAEAKMKKHYTSTNSYSFNAVVNNGVLTLSMTSAYTANIVPGRYVYDAELIFDGDTDRDRVIEGIATVTPGVT